MLLHGAADVDEGVERAGAATARKPGQGVQARHEQVVTLPEGLVHLDDVVLRTDQRSEGRALAHARRRWWWTGPGWSPSRR